MRDRLSKIDWIDLFLWVARAAIVAVILVGTVKTLINNPYTLRNWEDFIIFGIAQGSMYALIAIGYTLVYGVLQMINFAHGEFFMSGIFASTAAVAIPLARAGYLESHPVPSLLLIAFSSIVVSVLISLLTERIAYRPLRHAPRLMPLITAIGASFFLAVLLPRFVRSAGNSLPHHSSAGWQCALPAHPGAEAAHPGDWRYLCGAGGVELLH